MLEDFAEKGGRVMLIPREIIEEIVAREQVLRAEIAKIIAELEG